MITIRSKDHETTCTTFMGILRCLRCFRFADAHALFDALGGIGISVRYDDQWHSAAFFGDKAWEILYLQQAVAIYHILLSKQDDASVAVAPDEHVACFLAQMRAREFVSRYHKHSHRTRVAMVAMVRSVGIDDPADIAAGLCLGLVALTSALEEFIQDGQTPLHDLLMQRVSERAGGDPITLVA